MYAQHSVPSRNLADALGQGSLQALFQPKFNTGRRVAGVEALARWHRSNGEVLSPNAFVPACEHLGLGLELAMQMVSQAVRLAADWEQIEGLPLSVAINVHPRHICSHELFHHLRGALQRHGIASRQVVIEILEEALEEPTKAFLAALERYRNEGFRISIDDFGTGAAGLQRLLDMPAHEVKIASRYVQGVSTDLRKAALIKGIVSVAEDLDMDVVLEGIEDKDDLAWVSQLRYSRIQLQGFLLARPMSSAGLLHDLQVAHGQEPRDLPVVMGHCDGSAMHQSLPSSWRPQALGFGLRQNATRIVQWLPPFFAAERERQMRNAYR